MPFIVYFFLSLLIIYIPTPTLLLFFQKLASQHDNLTAFSKLFLLLMVLLDYYLSYYWLKNCKVKKAHYLYLVLVNVFEWLIHFYLYSRFETINLLVILLFQTVLLCCMIFFLSRRNFAHSFLPKKEHPWFPHKKLQLLNRFFLRTDLHDSPPLLRLIKRMCCDAIDRLGWRASGRKNDCGERTGKTIGCKTIIQSPDH